ncbi:MAG TPA: amino acid adenylation domain-containing protein, partial [Candidatus Binataceae bacterium]
NESDANPGTEVGPQNLCYVIYTSGSTGRPKGTLIQHDSVRRLLTSTEHWFSFGPKDVWTMFHSYSFDFSVWELWGALAYGGRLVIVGGETTKAPAEFYQLLLDEKVTVLNQTPSAFRQLMRVDETHCGRSGLALRAIIFGGEALDIAALGPWFDRHGDRVRLINMYGITETTVHVTYRELQAADVASAAGYLIGTPIPDLDIYLLDSAGRPVPDGMIGEIHVGGPGLARGYLRRPELTAERFVSAKFAPTLRLYRSGDLARRLSTGDLDYLGRIDHQVKIRGFRVELGEITAALHRLGSVKDCAVIAREEVFGDSRIIAYVVPDLPKTVDTQQDGAVTAWQSVFDRTYEHGRDDLPKDFNIVGWTSAYSGEAIPDSEMREWVEETVRSLIDLAPRRVLEIGCGTGLLLSRVAPHCESYHALDFSAQALESIQGNLLDSRPDLSHVRLHQASATELGQIPERDFDLIVINSVAQYFPSADYLASVLEESLNRLVAGGVLFVGDVRNRELNLALHASIELQGEKDASITDWARKARENAEREPELLVDPAFFMAFAAAQKRVTQVQIRHKRGASKNELTRFRFDAFLGVGGAPNEPEMTLRWSALEAHPDRLREMVQRSAPRSLLIRDVPNSRLEDIGPILEALSGDSSVARTNQLRLAMLEPEKKGRACNPQDFLTLADELAYRVVALCRPGAPLLFDVALQRLLPAEAGALPTDKMALPAQPASQESYLPLERYSNQPLRVRLYDQLVAEIDGQLSGNLPAFMLPSAYVLLDELPINENGKLDRKSLPPPPTRGAIATEYEAPRSDWERRIAPLFSAVLGLRRVGRNEDFFSLGGHSLLAAQLVFQIRDRFGVDVSLQSLFASPTVAGIATLLGGDRSQVSGIDLPKEAYLDDSILRNVRPDRAAATTPRGAFLTGATGFVGAFLLRALLDRTDGPVRCLVRARGDDEGRERLAQALAAYRLPVTGLGRVIPIAGDLARPQLGLSAQDFAALGAEVGSIYHNGAAINFAFPYSAV